MEQLNFDQWSGEENSKISQPEPKEELPQPSFSEEKVSCQYCEDVGPCMYCQRGRSVSSEIKKKPLKSKSNPRTHKKMVA